MTNYLINFRTTAVGDGTKKCYADRSSYVTVTTRDWRGAMVIGPEVEQFFCEMVPLQLTGPKSGAALQVLKCSIRMGVATFGEKL